MVSLIKKGTLSDNSINSTSQISQLSFQHQNAEVIFRCYFPKFNFQQLDLIQG